MVHRFAAVINRMADRSGHRVHVIGRVVFVEVSRSGMARGATARGYLQDAHLRTRASRCANAAGEPSRRDGALVKVLYFDCFSGISGDMALGALLDAGLPLDELKRALGSLTMTGYHVRADRVLRGGVSATKFSVVEDGIAQGTGAGAHEPDHAARPAHTHAHEHSHRSLPEIFSLIDTSALSISARDRAKAMFQRLAEVEAEIHQMPVSKVHLHEVGALDSIIDIVGIAHALEWTGATRVVSSALNDGGGMVRSAHGVFP